jgi:hypothetical protein
MRLERHGHENVGLGADSGWDCPGVNSATIRIPDKA